MNIRIVFLLFLSIFAFAIGCRRQPSNPPKYYQAELKEIEAQKIKAQQGKEEESLNDWYPWENKPTAESDCTFCNMRESEREYERLIDHYRETIHGKKIYRQRLRD